MPYVGNTPALNYTSFAVQHFTTSATTGYTLDHAVTNENDIRLVINNVVQQPGGSYAYTAAGTVLTLSVATAGTDTMYCVFLGKAVQTVNPGAGSVGTSQLATDAVTTVKILDTAVTGAKLNDDAISGQGALGAAPADTDEFLVSDAGVLKRVDYSYIKGITTANFLPTALPLIINGNMAVAQRGTSVTGVTGGGYRTCDRVRLNPSSAGTWTVIQESLSSGNAYTDGFSNAYRIDCTTANASLGAASHIYANTRLEGQDLQVFKKGTANAEKFTLAFWVKCNKTGTGQVNLQDVDNTRMCSGTYAISSADTWEHKVINFAADTTGVLGNDNGHSLRIEWYLDSGSDYDSGTAPTAWEATATADQNASGTLNLADNTNNDWAVTGIQLEVGEYTSATLPPFRHESYGANLLRCKRYYQQYPSTPATDYFMGVGYCGSTSEGYVMIPFEVQLRDTPSITYGTTGSWLIQGQTATYIGNGSNPDNQVELVQINSTGNLSAANDAAVGKANAVDALMKVSSEL